MSFWCEHCDRSVDLYCPQCHGILYALRPYGTPGFSIRCPHCRYEEPEGNCPTCGQLVAYRTLSRWGQAMANQGFDLNLFSKMFFALAAFMLLIIVLLSSR